ncbi:MAG: hypothetical protein JSW11_07310 [Candidatus Heimdallarchaeota archaeon]|nr:MAG: hypothetical protein JSW11_07310 [Candidatus Heimdallarchaeota archaeon]
MSVNKFTIFRLNFILPLGVLFLLPLTQVTAKVVWKEDWENPPFDEWTLVGYSYDDVNGFQPNTTNDPAVVDGVLKMNSPSDSFGNFWSSAYRNSTVAYGTWSFDWMVEPGEDHESYVNIFFLINDFPRNLTGVTIALPTPGYRLILQSGSKGPLGDNSINFFRSGVGDPLQTKVFTSSITGSHHIDITRSLNGRFNVFFDATGSSAPPIISITHNGTTTCEQFVVGSWIGDSAIDNITISDTIDVTPTGTTTSATTTDGTPSFELEVLVFSLVLFFIVSRKRRP